MPAANTPDKSQPFIKDQMAAAVVQMLEEAAGRKRGNDKEVTKADNSVTSDENSLPFVSKTVDVEGSTVSIVGFPIAGTLASQNSSGAFLNMLS